MSFKIICHSNVTFPHFCPLCSLRQGVRNSYLSLSAVLFTLARCIVYSVSLKDSSFPWNMGTDASDGIDCQVGYLRLVSVVRPITLMMELNNDKEAEYEGDLLLKVDDAWDIGDNIVTMLMFIHKRSLFSFDGVTTDQHWIESIYGSSDVQIIIVDGVNFQLRSAN